MGCSRMFLAGAWDPWEDNWDSGLAAAAAYSAEHGELRGARNYVTPDGFRLGTWLGARRRDRSTGVLSPERIAALDAVGMVWRTYDHAWEAALEEARRFSTEHGHLQIPFPFKSPSGFALGAWLNNQRVQRRKGILPESKIVQLDRLGIVWEPYDQDWNRGFKAASAYAEQHGDLLVPPRFVTADAFRLGGWISTRRTEKKSGKLAQQRVGQLDSLGMVWDPLAEKWELAMSAAHRYHAEHGDLRVPSLYVTPDGFRLGKWINHRRQFRKMGKLSPARIAQLDALGMNW